MYMHTVTNAESFEDWILSSPSFLDRNKAAKDCESPSKDEEDHISLLRRCPWEK